MTDGFKTEFAPAKRAPYAIIKKQTEIFLDNKIIREMANSIPNLLLILNKERQIVFANQNFISLLNLSEITDIIGKRPGEAVNCIHSKGEGGCGTTQFCSKCGAVNAILESQNNVQSIKECRITTVDQDALDFLVVATPYYVEEEFFTIFTLSDISNEKRRQTLERVFFHDVLNTAGGISGLSSVISMIEDPDEQKKILEIIHSSSETLIDEIKSQRQLSTAERGELELECSEVTSSNILKELSGIYSRHSVIENRKIIIKDSTEEIVFHTDRVLLKRVIGNMIKNALEASEKDGTVTVGAKRENNSIIFSVHNSTFIPRDVQLQLFKRSFSTKGSGRGIGTYSIKLFGEKFLKGKVWFESTEIDGTTFYIEISCECKTGINKN
ncbi:MAG: PAS domain-containing sensor histidine kinase [Prolixibacteraceae bacterium]|nr:PAS domain-containing sensor histidine kinase [Prolixibacteraceae bacterium]MBN2775688.1 PAS domain-containing sensor histidine kinase [Prolixibacteraceae bacterium]